MHQKQPPAKVATSVGRVLRGASLAPAMPIYAAHSATGIHRLLMALCYPFTVERATGTVTVNRAPVLTLWAAVVAERLGYPWDEALTLGKALAGLNAQSKGRALSIYSPAESGAARERRGAKPGARGHVDLQGRSIPTGRTPDG